MRGRAVAQAQQVRDAARTRGRRRPQVLGELATGRDNNLNLIRMIAASAVIISHAYPITRGPDALQPLETLTGVQLGSMALYAFFAISGFLITDSFHRSRTLAHFSAARFLRIFPGLLVVLLLTIVVLGPLTTTLPASEYFVDPATIAYVPRNLSLAFLQYELPGVFQTNPDAGPINGSLWTLFYEVVCYAGVVVVGLLGVFARRRRLLVTTVLYGLWWLAVLAVGDRAPETLLLLWELSLPFFIGMVLHAVRDRVRLSWLALVFLAALPVIAGPSLFGHLAVVAAISYGVFVIGYRIRGPILLYNRLGDYSYGTYIYGFPIQQTLIFFIPAMTAVWNATLGLIITFGFAWASWHLVEKPALGRKKALGTAMQRLTERSRIWPVLREWKWVRSPDAG